jgi:hypothetical protein
MRSKAILLLVIVALLAALVLMILNTKAHFDNYEAMTVALQIERDLKTAAVRNEVGAIKERGEAVEELRMANAAVSRLEHELAIASGYSQEETAQAMFVGCLVPASKMDPQADVNCANFVGQFLIRDNQVPVSAEFSPEFVKEWPNTWIKIMQAAGLEVQ